MFTLCEMLGSISTDSSIEWMHYLESAAQYLTNPLQAFLAAQPAVPFNKVLQEMFDYGKEVMADRRRNPREDLLSLIAHAEIEGEKKSQEYLDGSWLLIIFAGNDTTRNSLSGTMRR